MHIWALEDRQTGNSLQKQGRYYLYSVRPKQCQQQPNLLGYQEASELLLRFLSGIAAAAVVRMRTHGWACTCICNQVGMWPQPSH